jgi:hypothetical protein
MEDKEPKCEEGRFYKRKILAITKARAFPYG